MKGKHGPHLSTHTTEALFSACPHSRPGRCLGDPFRATVPQFPSLCLRSSNTGTPASYQENWWNNVCKAFSFERMKSAMTTKSKQYYWTFLSGNHFCLLNWGTTRRIKGVSLFVDLLLWRLPPSTWQKPRRERSARIVNLTKSQDELSKDFLAHLE